MSQCKTISVKALKTNDIKIIIIYIYLFLEQRKLQYEYMHRINQSFPANRKVYNCNTETKITLVSSNTKKSVVVIDATSVMLCAAFTK